MRIWVRLGTRFAEIGGLLMRVTDSLAPGIGAVRVDVFVLNDAQGLDAGLAKKSGGGSGFGFDLTLSDSSEEGSEGGA